MGTTGKIDISVPIYLKPRKPGWPIDAFCRGYSSEVIPKFYTLTSKCLESKTTPWTRQWLKENDLLLKKQREEIGPIHLEAKEDRGQAAQDAKEDLRDFNKQEKLDRRDAAIEAGTCDPMYTGSCKDDCRGKGVGGGCFRCSGQVVKLDDVTRPILNCDIQFDDVE